MIFEAEIIGKEEFLVQVQGAHIYDLTLQQFTFDNHPAFLVV